MLDNTDNITVILIGFFVHGHIENNCVSDQFNSVNTHIHSLSGALLTAILN